MKRYDPEAIKDRLIKRAQVDQQWSSILNNGTIGTLFDSISEGFAEVSRYLEFAYLEKKWRSARNMSSILHLADLISYKRQLPKSAIGYIIVSHTDPNGIERLSNYGSIFFNIDQSSDFDNLIQNYTATAIEKSALVPWTGSEPYKIPQGTIFKSGGISFISTEVVESRPLKEPWDSIKTDPQKLEDFITSGGWNGIKYVRVPVIQGEESIISFGSAKGSKFESYTIDSLNVENASNTISCNYFKVLVQPVIPGGYGKIEEWEEIVNIRLAGPYDKVFEKRILGDANQVLIKFGDGITGQIPPKNARLNCKYIETKGSAGNITEKFQVTNMQFPEGFVQVDGRTNSQTKFLSCTNILPIYGGKDIQSEDDIRVEAPPSYLQSYAIATKESYIYQIMNNAPIQLLHCRILTSDMIDVDSYSGEKGRYTSIVNNSVLTEVSNSKSPVIITAIRANGTLLDDPVLELIDPLIKSFGDRKSNNDSFEFVQPNIIEIRPNIIIKTGDTIPEKDIQNYIKPDILAKYSIFNSDFELPYYKQDIIKIAQQQQFTVDSEVFLETKEKVNLLPYIITQYNGVNTKECLNPNGSGILDQDNYTLCAFDFQFDKCFSQNFLRAGMRNYKNGAPYVVRVDLLLREDPSNNMSFFLYDDRNDLSSNKTLYEAETEPKEPLEQPNIIYVPDGTSNIQFFDELSENFQNRQVRTAQFNFVEKITSDSFFNTMKKWSLDPVEIRPLFIDENALNKQFLINEVPTEDRLSLSYTSQIYGKKCFYKNKQYRYKTKIEFSENYTQPDSEGYCKGRFIIPLVYLVEADYLQQLYEINANEIDLTKIAETLQKVLESKIEINAYAQPVDYSFKTINSFDIFCSNIDNILIQKEFILSK